MERFNDLAIILKAYPYQERDRIVVLLTENYGKLSAMAKGAVHSRRFGGSLDFLACSKVEWVQKPQAEMGRIESAVIRHEFTQLALDFERMTIASFIAEFCLRLIESNVPARELFVIVTNALFQLNAAVSNKAAVLNAFLVKTFKVMGNLPNILRCVQCGRGAHEVEDESYFWATESGGMICAACSDAANEKNRLRAETLLRFQYLLTTPFKEFAQNEASLSSTDQELFRVLADFFHHHIPGVPAAGLKSWRFVVNGLSE